MKVVSWACPKEFVDPREWRVVVIGLTSLGPLLYLFWCFGRYCHGWKFSSLASVCFWLFCCFSGHGIWRTGSAHWIEGPPMGRHWCHTALAWSNTLAFISNACEVDSINCFILHQFWHWVLIHVAESGFVPSVRLFFGCLFSKYLCCKWDISVL